MTKPQRVPPEVATEEIARKLDELIEAMKRVRGGRLNDRAIIILLSHITSLGQREIKAVLDGIESMSDYYLKKDPRNER